MIAASAGNHALALSYHGRDLGIPIFVVMPLIAPIMKVSMCKQYGANVIIHGEDIGVVSILCNVLPGVGGSLVVFFSSPSLSWPLPPCNTVVKNSGIVVT